MYKVNQTVKFIHPLRMEDKGKILAKLKVVDSKDGGYIGGNVYLITTSPLLQNDLVMEHEIIEVVR